MSNCAFPCAGSSPRVRGTANLGYLPLMYHRFIPACAGNGCRQPQRRERESVHPRVCGERSVNDIPEMRKAGSSPRVRGTVESIIPETKDTRFIPACAGNGANFRLKFQKMPVHPRVCGERYPLDTETARSAGSSPRVRGTDGLRSLGQLLDRFIPACAGNGFRYWAKNCRIPVHPRVCGERESLVCRGIPEDGSSPRVRGTADHEFPRLFVFRFIPACAGNGVSGTVSHCQQSVHPRVCGERLLC